MSTSNCLDSLIREVDSGTRAEGGQKRVAIDVNRRQVVNADWYLSAGSLKYFIVSTEVEIQCVTTVIIIVDEGEIGKAVGLKIDLKGRCAEGREDNVAEALCADPNPSTVFIASIKQWSHEYLSGRATSFLGSFQSERAELASYLVGRVLTEIGLDLSVEVSLYGPGTTTRPTTLGPLNIEVRLRNYPSPLWVELVATLAPNNLVDAVAYRGEDANLQQLIIDSTQHYFSDSIPLARFSGGLDHITPDLKSYLNERLKTMGQQVQRLRLRTEAIVLPDECEVSQQIEYRVLGQPEPILVKDIARITVQDYELYADNNEPSLADWLASVLNHAVQDTFSGKTYAMILRERDTLTRDLKNRMSFKAAGIGCLIQQELTLTIPGLERWMKIFEIPTEETFATRLEGFPVTLKIGVAAMLREPGEITRYLDRGMDLYELMVKKIHDEARQLLQTVHPGRLIAPGIAGESTVEEPAKAVLGRRIREMFLRDFNADVVSVVIENADSGAMRSLNSFCRQSIDFEAEVSSHRGNSVSPVTYYFECQVEEFTARGWEVAAASGFDFGKLKTQLVNMLKAELETQVDRGPSQAANAATEAVRSELDALLITRVLSQFGFKIRILTLRRRATDVEKKMREAALANELARVEMLRKLEHRVLELIANGGKAEEIAACRARITELKVYATAAVNNDDMWTPEVHDMGVPAVQFEKLGVAE